MADCDLCEGTGECQNDFHTNFAGIDPSAWVNLVLDNQCPACGGDPDDPGNCSKCGGDGEMDDEDESLW